MPNLGPTELLIILAIALLLFGGSRLAGVGKGTGRAIREFKEETRGLREADKAKEEAAKAQAAAQQQVQQAQQQVQQAQQQVQQNPALQAGQPYVQQAPASGQYDQPIDAEIVDNPNN